MELHASDFGWISFVAALFLSFTLLAFFLQKLPSILKRKSNQSNLITKILITFASGIFVFLPLIFSTAIGYSLHKLHYLIRGPFTYGFAGYESSYTFGSQLLAVGLVQFFICAYFIQKKIPISHFLPKSNI